MADRTVTIGTASKLLALTGWRQYRPARGGGGGETMKSYTMFCAPTPPAACVAAALNKIADDAEATRLRGHVR